MAKPTTPLNVPSIFSSLSPKEVSSLSSIATLVTFPAEANLPFKSRDKKYTFYVITSGHVKLSYKTHLEHPIRICGPGDILGYGEWYYKYPHVAESLDTVQAWEFQNESFEVFLYKTPRLQKVMTQCLFHILSMKDERIVALENHSVRNRVALTLLSFARKFGKKTDQGLLIDVKVDRETIAKLAGTVTESLSRQLSELESEQIIHRDGRSIYIDNLKKLQEKSMA